MRKGLPAICILLFFTLHTHAQIAVMKLVGPGTKDYSIGFGAFIKSAIPASDAADVTIEIGANFFPSGGWGNGEGTAMCPLKVGYRYTLNGTGEGFYLEPQAGYNVYGVTSITDERGVLQNLKYHGVVLAAGAGYLFSIWELPFDLNLRYETVMAHGGSNNFISLGISRFISFGRRD